MRRQWKVAAVGAAALAVSLAPLSAAFASGGHAGQRGPSLSGWRLFIPRDSNGGTSGCATTVSPARIDSPWLTRTVGGALDFWAPADGAVLCGARTARTELTGTGTFTLGHGNASLNETVRVTRLPDSGHHIIIGQMFAGGVSPFAEMHYQDTKLYGFVHGQSQAYVLMTDIPLNATFRDSIKAVGSNVFFSVTFHGHTVTKQLKDISSFEGDTMHFQAGDYQQDPQGSPSTDGGRVIFTSLKTTGV